MTNAIAEPCPACGEPLDTLGGVLTVCLHHDGLQEGEIGGGKRVKTEQDIAYDKYIKAKWEREVGVNWEDLRVKKP